MILAVYSSAWHVLDHIVKAVKSQAKIQQLMRWEVIYIQRMYPGGAKRGCGWYQSQLASPG